MPWNFPIRSGVESDGMRWTNPSDAATTALWWILLVATIIRALIVSHRSPVRNSHTGKLVLFVVGVASLAVSQIVGAFIAGPLVRAVFGEPFDFHSDYTSPQALFQAVVTQVAAASLTFTGVGIIIGKRTRITGDAFWACNPLSMLSGVLVILAVTDYVPMAFENVPSEYLGPIQWAFHIVANSGVYAWLLDSGRRIAARQASPREFG
jgi:cytochrome bd-type quinol oxidase subunit 2